MKLYVWKICTKDLFQRAKWNEQHNSQHEEWISGDSFIELRFLIFQNVMGEKHLSNQKKSLTKSQGVWGGEEHDKKVTRSPTWQLKIMLPFEFKENKLYSLYLFQSVWMRRWWAELSLWSITCVVYN